MSERPIPFRDWEVRATLKGVKTQTRRMIKPQPWVDNMGNACWKDRNFGQSANHVPHIKALASPIPCSDTKRVLCPYGAPDDLLWVRETFCAHWGGPLYGAPLSYRRLNGDELPPIKQKNGDVYQPKDSDIMTVWYGAEGDKPFHLKWKPSIHMPRWASRITLRITDVRVERLQDISEADARAEGCPYPPEWANRFMDRDETARTWFKSLWNHINGPGAWEANDWVWVISFKRVKP